MQVVRQRIAGAGSCRQRRAAVHSHAALMFFVEGGATVEQASGQQGSSAVGRGAGGRSGPGLGLGSRRALAAPLAAAETWRISAGDVKLVPAGMPHRMLEARDGVRWGMGFCMPCFATDLGALYEPFERVRAGGAAVLTIDAERRARLEGLLGELEQALARRDRASDTIQRSLLALVLDEISRASPPLGTGASAEGAGAQTAGGGRQRPRQQRLDTADSRTADPRTADPRTADPQSGDSSSVSRSDCHSSADRTLPLGGLRPPPSALVADSLRFIERNCLAPLTLGDVAAAIGKSPAHLTTALRRATGRSAVQWIIAGRLAEARRRLASTTEPIDRIAERVGYADATHFIRLFRREHGVTPAAWRAQHP